MTRLVALDLPGGTGFVRALEAAWDRGDAVAVVPRDLPDAGRAGWFDAVRPIGWRRRPAWSTTNPVRPSSTPAMRS
ncbi:MAG: hypothetical protein R2702_18145 [Acidimicrobiales bacterium]